jgi:hypothetical protein
MQPAIGRSHYQKMTELPIATGSYLRRRYASTFQLLNATVRYVTCASSQQVHSSTLVVEPMARLKGKKKEKMQW